MLTWNSHAQKLPFSWLEVESWHSSLFKWQDFSASGPLILPDASSLMKKIKAKGVVGPQGLCAEPAKSQIHSANTRLVYG